MLEIISLEPRRLNGQRSRLFQVFDTNNSINSLVLENENTLVTNNGLRTKIPSSESIIVAVFSQGPNKINKYPELLDFSRTGWGFILPQDRYSTILIDDDYKKLEIFLLEVIRDMAKRKIKTCTPYWWPEMIEVYETNSTP